MCPVQGKQEALAIGSTLKGAMSCTGYHLSVNGCRSEAWWLLDAWMLPLVSGCRSAVMSNRNGWSRFRGGLASRSTLKASRCSVEAIDAATQAACSWGHVLYPYNVFTSGCQAALSATLAVGLAAATWSPSPPSGDFLTYTHWQPLHNRVRFSSTIEHFVHSSPVVQSERLKGQYGMWHIQYAASGLNEGPSQASNQNLCHGQRRHSQHTLLQVSCACYHSLRLCCSQARR